MGMTGLPGMLLWPSPVRGFILILGSTTTAKPCLDLGSCINFQIKPNNTRFCNTFSPPPMFPPCFQLEKGYLLGEIMTEWHHTHQFTLEITAIKPINSYQVLVSSSPTSGGELASRRHALVWDDLRLTNSTRLCTLILDIGCGFLVCVLFVFLFFFSFLMAYSCLPKNTSRQTYIIARRLKHSQNSARFWTLNLPR